MNKTEETVGETKTQTSPQNNEISTNNTIATENILKTIVINTFLFCLNIINIANKIMNVIPIKLIIFYHLTLSFII